MTDNLNNRNGPIKQRPRGSRIAWLILIVAPFALAWESPQLSNDIFGLLGCEPTPDVTVEQTWALQASGDDNPFVSVAPRENGEVLILAKRGNVYNVDATGHARRVYTPETRASVVLNPSGDTFGVYGDQTTKYMFTLYDAMGAPLGMQQMAPTDYFRPVPSSALVFAPEVQPVGIGKAVVVKGRIVNSDGEVQSTFPAEGLQFHRLTANHVFYATKKEFVKTEISG
ncbi:MAG: hypothetical protein GY854_22210, partial [Deltaproteobacteria bacterium]|nr:hypothetical protein [Deltaproteobacteria bacterium]